MISRDSRQSCSGLAGRQKHPCPDCRMCQWCAESRCHLCRSQAPDQPHLSMAEQIALYEKINAEE